MEMILMGACVSMFGLAVTCLAFGAATRPSPQTPAAEQPQPAAAQAVAKARFFVDRVAVPAAPQPALNIPIEALLLQIENHVRLEQAAAESFLRTPSPALLHSQTISPLVN
jgi:hypothetical protein